MRTIHFNSSKERIIASVGASLIGTILDRSGFIIACNNLGVASLHPFAPIKVGDLFAVTIANLCRGERSFESTREYENDEAFYLEALGIDHIPSPEILRQRLDEIGMCYDGPMSVHNALRDMNVQLLLDNGAVFTAIPEGFVPLDIDVTPFDESKSHKEGVGRTYKNFDGYAPLNCYLGGIEGYLINVDFRVGTQHSQKGTPKVLIETIDIANRLIGSQNLLVRLDSGNDAIDNLGILMERGHYFIVKRNLRQESKEGWLELAKENAPIHENPREGKDVYIGSTWKPVTYVGMDGKKKTTTVRIVFEVTERTIDKNGQILMFPDIEVNTWWDNTGLNDKRVIELYHEHATMEQYHSEIKTDMGVEKMPSGKFGTNRLMQDLIVIAYNVLRLIGMELNGAPNLPMQKPAYRRRIRTVINHIMLCPGRVKTSGRCTYVDLGGSNVWAATVVWLNRRFNRCVEEAAEQAA